MTTTMVAALNLIHYAATPVGPLESREQDIEGGLKPKGLWVSVEGNNDGWRAWCEAEQFGLDRLVVAHRVTLAEGANILHLTGAEQLDDFTANYSLTTGWLTAPDRLGYRIDWRAVADKYLGIVIAPYIWSRRLALHTHWYYGWDCASGCIWDPAAIASVEVSEPCGCTPLRECDEHDLEADVAFERSQDRSE